MILVCVGASEFPFDRLLKMIDDLCDDGVIKGDDIIAQTGVSEYKAKNYKTFSLIGRNEFQEYMKQADIVITHAGTGSVLPPLKAMKKVIVVPRKAQLNEHIDDHQNELAEIFTTAGYTLCANNKEELRNAIEKCQSFQPEKYKSDNMKINNIVLDFIKTI